jgi:V8-like Glu-specific endopeptidase
MSSLRAQLVFVVGLVWMFAKESLSYKNITSMPHSGAAVTPSKQTCQLSKLVKLHTNNDKIKDKTHNLFDS